ncbi:nitrogen fixation protein NifM [Desulforhopalus vacuolatus]|uniref:nitrogen fixation protein NifM n=1 Tax=Desulforhopalus vacuolatus TaxID=40414 RepID=UPI001963428A|nr:nitrogen fixation protein NifM [Desulforhopalus vacuolatus]MBM9518217.1 nitrogen fixation protein NifM [Desulforhopalus vacuolatus]
MLQPSLPYNQLKFSLQMFHRPLNELEKSEYEAVKTRAEAECTLERKILTSKEGMKIKVAQESTEEAIAAIANRYESPEAFQSDLRANNMDLAAMASGLEVELMVKAALKEVAARTEPPDEAEVTEIFEAGDQKKREQRQLCHILITINDQFPENRREAALARITRVHEKVLASGGNFSELAQRYSECPSAVRGGNIGPVARGTLHPSLEETLFAMERGEISKIVESTMGFHILLCEEVLKGDTLPPEETKAKIRKVLHARNKKKTVQTWLAAL